VSGFECLSAPALQAACVHSNDLYSEMLESVRPAALLHCLRAMLLGSSMAGSFCTQHYKAGSS
jgi:hypothetical protein